LPALKSGLCRFYFNTATNGLYPIVKALPVKKLLIIYQKERLTSTLNLSASITLFPARGIA
jgi:hypothetical protein